MKKFLFALLMFVASNAVAQIVYIPDPNFKEYLVEYGNHSIDINGDNEIQVSEAQAINALAINFDISTITDITGLEAFTNLDSLIIYSLTLNYLNLSGMASLKYLDIDQGVDSINLSNCTNLEWAWLGSGYGADSIHSINLDGVHRLKYMWCNNLNVSSLDLRQCDSLQEFIMSIGGYIGEVNVSGMSRLRNLTLSGHVEMINANNATNLEKIYMDATMDEAHLDNLFVNGCTRLEGVALHYFHGSGIDYSSCPNIRSVSGTFTNLRYLNIKNGANLWGIFGYYDHLTIVLPDSSPPLYVCADENETNYADSIIRAFNSASISLTVNSFCTATPGGAFNTIKGKVKVDVNGNGCDNADPSMPNVPVVIGNGVYSTVRYTNATEREYRYYDFAGNFTLTPYFPYPYFNNPAPATVSFGSANSIIDTTDFCVTPNGIHNQVDITFLPIGAARPGFTARYQLVYRNRGTTTLSGNLQLNYSNNKMNYNTASVTPSLQLPGQLKWSYANLQPFETRSIQVQFILLPPPDTNNGDTLLYLAMIEPVAGDETPADNSFILPQRTTGSFDPNDKTCLEGEKIDITQIGDKLHYVIHFQNLGTDTAFKVVVTDTLSDLLDWESFDFLGSSHSCDAKRTGNKLEFYLDDILLPHQAVNDIGSNGYVAFSIRPKGSVAVGDSLNNMASIYFDFNPPVVTNRTVTIVTNNSAPVPVKIEFFSLASKGKSNILTWKVSCTSSMATFNIERSAEGSQFTQIGMLTANEIRCRSPFSFTDEKPLPGKNFYRIRITDAEGITYYSKILVTGNNAVDQSLKVLAVGVQQGNAIVYIDNNKPQTIQFKLLAADGRVLYSGAKILAAGNNQFKLPFQQAAGGIYTLVVYTVDAEIITKRFVK